MSQAHSKPDYVQYVTDPEHFEGKLYPEWQLSKMGEGDNEPQSPEQAGWDEHLSKEEE